MSYIGNPIITQAFLTDQFSGNGSTTVFTMSVAPANTASVLVTVSGVVQDPTTYAVFGTTLTFSVAPPSGTANISCRYLGIPASGVATTAYRTVTEFTATASQTTFTPPSYTVGYIDVLRNGVRLGSADYTASNGTTVVLAAAASAGDLITVVSMQVSSVLNAVPSTGGAITGNLNITGDESVTGKIQIQQDSGSNNRLILRGQPSSSYRWNIDNYSSSNNLRIFRENDSDASSGAVILNLNSNGALALSGASSSANGVGITFPATQSPSSDANTLDDYEEGTWSPTFAFTGGSVGITYNFQNASYIKIGRMVCVTGYLAFNNKGTSTGTLLVGNFPFTAVSTSNFWQGVAIGYYSGFASVTGGVVLEIPPSGTYGTMMYNGSTAITNTNASNGAGIEFSFCYVTG